MLGISPDAPAKLAKFREKDGLTITLLSDADKSVMTAYGAFGEKKLYGKVVNGVIRSTFVVDEDGKVELAQYNVKATGHVAKLRRDLGLDAWPEPRPAEVVELADTQVLGTCAFGRGGSSPPFGTQLIRREPGAACEVWPGRPRASGPAGGIMLWLWVIALPVVLLLAVGFWVDRERQGRLACGRERSPRHRRGTGVQVLQPLRQRLSRTERSGPSAVTARALTSSTAMRTSRLEAFSDGVLAIIITIMVLELHVPEGPKLADLADSATGFLTYLLSFVYIGIYWNNHHHMFQLVRRVDGTVLWANLHLLFWLSLYPFTTAWMDETDLARTPLVDLRRQPARGRDRLLPAGAGDLPGRGSGRRCCGEAVGRDLKGKVSPVIYLAGIVTAMLVGWPALFFYAAVAAIWLVPDRRMESYVAEHGLTE